MNTVAARLSQIIARVPGNLKSMTEEALIKRPQPGKWSKKEIMGHLIDSAYYNLLRFKEAQYATPPYVVRNYAQDALVTLNDYQHLSLEEILQRWMTLNRQIIQVITRIPKDKLSVETIAEDGSPLGTLSFIIEDYLAHMEHHLRQIFPDQDYMAEEHHTYQVKMTVEEALTQLKNIHPQQFVDVLRHGTLEVEIYAPEKVDLQQPHTRDEVYVIIRGEGMFLNGEQRHAFQAGDVLFVPAGVIHRFEDFSDDFITWVLFYGPEGGEKI
jgi:mannose-6-phosphate isomerase-like protein (cupin superfamily)